MATFDPVPRDDFNPYETPSAPLGRPEWAMDKPRGSTLPFEVGAIFGRTWEIFKQNLGLCIGTMVGCAVMNGVVQNVPGMLASIVGGVSGAMAAGPGGGPGGPPAINNAAQTQIMLTVGVIFFVLGIAALVFQLWIGVGQTLVFLKIAQGRDASFNDVFKGGRYLIRYVLATIVVSLLAGVGTAVGVIPAVVAKLAGLIDDQQVMLGVLLIGLLAAFGIMLVFLFRFSQYYFLIIDRDAGAIESIRMSSDITRGRLMGIAGISLLAGLVNLGGLLACIIGLVATFPFTILLFAVTYQALVGGPVADPLGVGKPMMPGDPLFEV